MDEPWISKLATFSAQTLPLAAQVQLTETEQTNVTSKVDIFIGHSWSAGRASKFLALCLSLAMEWLKALKNNKLCLCFLRGPSISKNKTTSCLQWLTAKIFQSGDGCEMFLRYMVLHNDHATADLRHDWLGGQFIGFPWLSRFANAVLLRCFHLWAATVW